VLNLPRLRSRGHRAVFWIKESSSPGRKGQQVLAICAQASTGCRALRASGGRFALGDQLAGRLAPHRRSVPGRLAFISESLNHVAGG
jgi:hypothetical protein